MGRVYLAEHRHLKRKAALKLLTKDLVERPDLVERFFMEARATSAIAHPGIVQIFDCEVAPSGQPYIVMEYLEGETLAARLARTGPLAPVTAARLAHAIAEALDAAHASGIVHRDLKPENMFVRTEPTDSIKLVDFGIAKLAGDLQSQQVHKTRSGILMGTPLYMSPEQCRDSGRIDFRTDIYSLGCVLFEMLTGRPPFVREGLGELMVAHLTEAPPEVQTLAPGVPPALAELTGLLLRKDPAQRPENMKMVATRLMAFVAGVTTVRETLPPAEVAAAAAATMPPRTATVRPITVGPTTTTFEHSASEVVPAYEDDVLPRRRRAPLVIGVVFTLAAVGAGAALFKSSSETPSTAPRPTAAASTTPTSETTRPTPPAPTPAAKTGHQPTTSPAKGDSASKKQLAATAAAAKKAPAAPAARPGGGTAPTESVASRPSTTPGKPAAPSPAPNTPPRPTSQLPTSPPPIAATTPTAAPTPGPGPTTPPPPSLGAPQPTSASELSGAWEGPWEDHGKQQKGRLFLQIGHAGAVSGWMYNRAAKESFRLIGTLSPRGEVDLVCKCPPQQGFVARGSIRASSAAELVGQLSLSSGGGVFGQSHLTLRRTTQTR